MGRQGKKYQESVKLVDKAQAYHLREAIDLAKKSSYVKFDEAVELHLRMGVNPRNADQQVRGVALLPHGLGRKVRILVFTQGEGEKIAKEAGADYTGSDEMVKKIEEGWLDFDVAIATPDVMPKLGKLGKILGRRGLMPNPKAGTIVPSQDLPRAIEEVQKGRVEFKLDRTAIIHAPVGKVSFEEDRLFQNVAAVVDAVVKARPSGAKGQYIRSAFLTTSMGPGIRLDLQSTLALHA